MLIQKKERNVDASETSELMVDDYFVIDNPHNCSTEFILRMRNTIQRADEIWTDYIRKQVLVRSKHDNLGIMYEYDIRDVIKVKKSMICSCGKLKSDLQYKCEDCYGKNETRT